MIGLFERTLLSRRQFLRRAGIATGAVLGTALIRDLDALAQPTAPLEIVIVGAGLAGLVAAYELEKRGHRITLLEADPSHVGGRVRTLRFDDGLYGEAGAMRIPERHEITRHYIAEFGLRLRRFVHSNPEAYFYLRGQRERIKDGLRLNRLYALREDERDKTGDELWTEAVVARLDELSAAERADLSAVEPRTAAIRALDQQSLQQVCEAAGLSEEAIELLSVSSGQEMMLTTAATELLREELNEIWTQPFEEIEGGTDRLPAAFNDQLRSKAQLGCEVVRLEQSPLARRAAAIYLQDGEERRVEGDFLLCTLPLPVLGRLIVEPGFSGPKQRAIRELNYDSSTKVLAVTNRRFWETDDGIYGGGTFTDLPTGTTYYPSDNAAARDPGVSAGPGVLLASYSWGQAARRLGSLPHRETAELTLRQLARVHPQLADPGVVRGTASWSWDRFKWAGGAFAWFMPGQHTTLYKDLLTPEGRIYFAGEHASLAHTWMQGALESGLRAVQEMLLAAG